MRGKLQGAALLEAGSLGVCGQREGGCRGGTVEAQFSIRFKRLRYDVQVPLWACGDVLSYEDYFQRLEESPVQVR